jgi:hypothetical protein
LKYINGAAQVVGKAWVVGQNKYLLREGEAIKRSAYDSYHAVKTSLKKRKQRNSKTFK